MTAARISLAELLRSGLTFSAQEAVTVARAALEHDPSGEPGLLRPHEPLRPGNVYVVSDGTVVVPHCTVPDMSGAARLLQAMLPPGTPGVPGALRYTVARALLEVDAPPFGSAEAFSGALARFQNGDRAEILNRMLSRAGTRDGLAARGSTERRRPRSVTVSNLRHALREADARLFEQERAWEVSPSARPSRARKAVVAAAFFAAALALLVTGGAMRGRLWTAPAQAPARPVEPSSPAAAIQTAQPDDIVLEPPVRTTKVAGRSTREASPKAGRKHVKNRRASNKPGFLARFHLQWLRKVFS